MSKKNSKVGDEIVSMNMLMNFISNSSDYFLKSILKIPPEYRSEKLVRAIGNALKSYQSFLTQLYSKNNDLLENFLIPFSKYLESKEFGYMKTIKKSGESDDTIFLLLSGNVIELSMKYDKFAIKKKDYITHLIKLCYLKEKELFEQTIHMNKSVFPFSYDVNQWINDIKEPEKQREFLLLFDQAKNEVDNSKYKTTRLINDYIDLVNYDSDNSKSKQLRKSYSENAFSLKKNNVGDANINYNLYIVSYKITSVLRKGDFIGCLAFTTKVKFTKTYIVAEKTECAMFPKNKKENLFVMNKLKQIRMHSIGPFHKSFFIFQDLSRQYFEENIIQYFTYNTVKKGDYIIEQGDKYNGVFCIINGEFRVTTHQSYTQLDLLITNLKESLRRNYSSFINSLDKINNKPIENNPRLEAIFKNKDFIIKSKEIKEIELGIINQRQLIGTDEFFNNKTELNHFSVQCISNTADFFYLPKENFNSVRNKNKLIFHKLGKLIEQKSQLYILEVKKFKENFENEIEGQIKFSRMKIPTPPSHNGHNNSFISPLQMTSTLNGSLNINRSQSKRLINNISNNEKLKRIKIIRNSNSELNMFNISDYNNIKNTNILKYNQSMKDRLNQANSSNSNLCCKTNNLMEANKLSRPLNLKNISLQKLSFNRTLSNPLMKFIKRPQRIVISCDKKVNSSQEEV